MIIPARLHYYDKKHLRETVIRIKLKETADGVSVVRQHLPATAGEFRNPGLMKDGIYKRTEFAIENVFDICAIIKTDLALDVPGDDEDILMYLLDNGLISLSLQEKIHRMRGFRTIVVHRYGTIDDALAFQLLTGNIGDFSLFAAGIEKVLDRYR